MTANIVLIILKFVLKEDILVVIDYQYGYYDNRFNIGYSVF